MLDCYLPLMQCYLVATIGLGLFNEQRGAASSDNGVKVIVAINFMNTIWQCVVP